MPQDIIKNIPLALDINARKRLDGTVDIRLYSKDIATGQFEFTFIDEGGNPIALDETYSAQALVRYNDEEKTYLNDMTIDGNVIRFIFPHDFITKNGTVTMYIYITKGDYTSDVAAISFPVFVSEIDKDLDPGISVHYIGKIEQLIQDMKDKVASYQVDVDEIIGGYQEAVTKLVNMEIDYKPQLVSLTTQLAQVNTDKIDKHGASQVTWANIAQDARLQISGDKIAIVGKDAVGYENVIDNSLDGDKLSLFQHVKYNLFNPNKAKDGVRLSTSTGTEYETDSENYTTSEYIFIDGSKGPLRIIFDDSVTEGSISGIWFYDTSKNYVERVVASKTGNVIGFENVNNLTGLIRIVFLKEHKHHVQVGYREDVFEGVFEPYSFELESKTKENIMQQLRLIDHNNRVNFEYGAINVAGAESPSTSRVRTGFIKSSKYQTIQKINSDLVYFVLFYDESKNFTGYSSSWTNNQDVLKITSPYFKITVRYDDEKDITETDLKEINNSFIINHNMIVDEQISPNTINENHLHQDLREKVNQLSDTRITGKRILNIGDSIASAATPGVDGYHVQISREYNMPVVSYAQGGATARVRPLTDNNVVKQVDDAIAGDVQADYILLNVLTNDANTVANESEIGEISEGYEAELNTSTFAGALEYIFKTLKTHYDEAKILYIRPHNVANRSDNQITLGNLALEICKKWSIPYVDMYSESGLQTQIPSYIEKYCIPDDGGAHPNTLGYEKYYVPLIEAKMKSI